jgi:hypothetical protein
MGYDATSLCVSGVVDISAKVEIEVAASCRPNKFSRIKKAGGAVTAIHRPF